MSELTLIAGVRDKFVIGSNVPIADIRTRYWAREKLLFLSFNASVKR